ncbi:MAG: hypothetical protein ABIO67_06920, partial [Mycobacteriales bacterium]
DRLMAAAAEHLGLLGSAADVERDGLVRVDLQVENLERALRDAATMGLKAGLDAVTLAGAVADMRRELAEARDHRALLVAMLATTDAETSRLGQVTRLAEVARERLVNADAELRRTVLDLLDVRVTILSHGGRGGPVRAGRGGSQSPMQLRVEGSIAHGLVLASAESDWHPRNLVTGRG